MIGMFWISPIDASASELEEILGHKGTKGLFRHLGREAGRGIPAKRTAEGEVLPILTSDFHHW